MIILGGGLAGLCSAYELTLRGFEVLVLEATQRTGGRVLTRRRGFQEGQYAELGATRIPNNHELTLGYVSEFGLALDEFPAEDSNTLFYLSGKRFIHSPTTDRDPPMEWRLSELERKQGVEWILSDYERRSFPRFSGIAAEERGSHVSLKDLDEQSYVEYLRAQGASEGATRLIAAANGSETSDYSALTWLSSDEIEEKWERSLRIRGGNDRLPEAFTQKLGDRIRYRSQVKRVESTPSGVAVTFQQDGKVFVEQADFSVCALPVSLLKEIEFQPALSAKKQKAIHDTRMQTVSRLNFQFRNRFWEQEGTRGLNIAYTDTGIERLWDMSSQQPGRAGILTAYVVSAAARRISDLAPTERIPFGLGEVAKFYPQAKKEFLGGVAWCWHEQPWVKGAWAIVAPGQSAFAAHLASREGNCLFAGDHTTLRAGWMQGALESAHRAVQQIVSSV